jgi:hypothetical protein
MPSLIDVTSLDLSSIVKGERQHVVSDHIAKTIVSRRAEFVMAALEAYRLDDYEPRDEGFIPRLMEAGRLTLLGYTKVPIELYYLDRLPLVGFLAPMVKMQATDAATVISLDCPILNADAMPAIDDKQGQTLLLAIMLQASYKSANKT